MVAWNDEATDLGQWHSQVGNQEQKRQEGTPAEAVQIEY